MKELKRCPNCESELVIVNKRKGKYRIECGGDCWTQTNWYWSLEEAIEEWNRIVPQIENEE